VIYPPIGWGLALITPEQLGRELADVFNKAYNEETNMCDCHNKKRAEAWDAVCNAFPVDWASRFAHLNGQDAAVAEIKRLQYMEKLARRLEKEVAEARTQVHDWIGVAERRLNERNGQVQRAECAENNLHHEREKHTETLKLLEEERKVSKTRFDTCVQLQQQLERAQSETDNLRVTLADVKAQAALPVMGGGYQAHTQNVRNAVRQYQKKGFGRNCPEEVAEAVYFLLQRVEKLEAVRDAAPKTAMGAVQEAQTGRPTAPKPGPGNGNETPWPNEKMPRMSEGWRIPD